MKTIIFILLFPVFATAQTKFSDTSSATLTIPMDFSGSFFDSTVFYKDADTLKYKQDTVRCIMLVSDTAEQEVGKMEDGTMVLWLNDQCTWKYGFQISSHFSTEIYGSGVNIYLDSDKKRLPPNIVVWATKEY